MALSFGLGLPPAPKKGVGVLRFTSALPPSVTYARTGAATALTVAGAVMSFAANAPQLTDRGLLLEAAATNLDPNSLTIGGTGWTTNASPTITQNAATAPDGTMTAVRVQSAASNSGPWRGSVSLANATTYTRSLWLKDNGGSVKTVRLGVGQAVFGGAGGDRNVTVNVADGTLSNIDPVYSATSVFAGENGWRRVSLTFTTTSASASAAFTIYGSESGVDFLVWDHDLEAGAVASSSIITTGATATRGLPTATIIVPTGKTIARATYGLSNTAVDVTGLTPGSTFDLVTGRPWLGLGNELKTLEWRP